MRRYGSLININPSDKIEEAFGKWKISKDFLGINIIRKIKYLQAL